jgi:hypothetical protein
MARVNDQMFEKCYYPFVPRSHTALFVSSLPNAEMHANLTSRMPTLMLCDAKSVAKYPKRLNSQSSIDLLQSNFSHDISISISRALSASFLHLRSWRKASPVPKTVYEHQLLLGLVNPPVSQWPSLGFQ